MAKKWRKDTYSLSLRIFLLTIHFCFNHFFPISSISFSYFIVLKNMMGHPYKNNFFNLFLFFFLFWSLSLCSKKKCFSHISSLFCNLSSSFSHSSILICSSRKKNFYIKNFFLLLVFPSFNLIWAIPLKNFFVYHLHSSPDDTFYCFILYTIVFLKKRILCSLKVEIYCCLSKVIIASCQKTISMGLMKYATNAASQWSLLRFFVFISFLVFIECNTL